MKRHAIFALVFLLLFVMAGCGDEANSDLVSTEAEGATEVVLAELVVETGFDSPEDAVIAYLEGLRDSDLNRMIYAFAVERYVENYNFEALLNRLQAYTLTHEIRMPNANEFVTAMNIESRRARVIDGIIMQHIFLAHPELDMLATQAVDVEHISDFVGDFSENLNALDLYSIEILGFIPPEALDERYLSEHNQSVLASQAEVLGAEQLASRVAVFEMDGEKYLLLVDVAEYKGAWYLSDLGGNIGILLNISSFLQGMFPAEHVPGSVDVQALIVLH